MKKTALVLVLLAIVPYLIASPAKASPESVDPDTVWLTLKCGESAEVEKTVIVPAAIPKADILFSFDLTGSMADEIDVVKAQAYNIMVTISGLVDDPTFGVMSYMDYPHYYDTCGYAADYGFPGLGDYAYKLDQALTSDTALIRTVIEGLVLGSGWDAPQDYERIFYESYADSLNIGYRPGSKKILLNFGDCVPHDCNLSEGIDPDTTITTGGDPGRDETMGNSDDLDLQTILAEMVANEITLLEVHGENLGCEYPQDYWEDWCSWTGGGFYLLSEAAQIPAAVESLILEQALHIDSLTLEVMTPGFESWLTSLTPPYYLDITGPDTLHFTEEISVPAETLGGDTDTFQISAIGDGVSYGDQIVIVEVPVDQPPSLVCPDDDSVHAADKFISTDYSVTDPDDSVGVTVVLDTISPTPTNPPSLIGKHIEWSTSCEDLTNGPVFTITLVATDPCGAADTCQFTVTVYNQPPEITCPDDDSVHAGDKFVSTDFSTTDQDGDQVTVALCGITPTPTNQPSIVDNHVEWQTACDDTGYVFNICLEATDSCGAVDTCYFDVTVYNRPPEITCPDDDSVHAGDKFVSTDFSTTDPDGGLVTVALCGVMPSPTNPPSIVDNHVEWQTACDDTGYVFNICLEATNSCGATDTCYFDVTVYNRPPEITCPDDDSVHAGDKFVSTDFSTTDPDGGLVTVALCGVMPSPTNPPSIVDNHVEWQTAYEDTGKVFTICLEATDSCGATDTCEFEVTVVLQPPEITCPDTMIVHHGPYSSGDFTVTHPEEDSIVQIHAWVAPVGQGIQNLSVYGGTGITTTSGHVEFDADCHLPGVYYICLEATDKYGFKDTCCFQVTVINEPPELTCPNDTTINCGDTLNSTPFYFIDPEDDNVWVTYLDINPPPTYSPFIVCCTYVRWLTTCVDGGEYVIRLIATDECGAADTCEFTIYVSGTTDAGDLADNSTSPKRFALLQNQPNPFNPYTDLRFTLPHASPYSMKIYNVAGQLVRSYEDMGNAGLNVITWDGRNDFGREVASGVYFYRLVAGEHQAIRKMIMLK